MAHNSCIKPNVTKAENRRRITKLSDATTNLFWCSQNYYLEAQCIPVHWSYKTFWKVKKVGALLQIISTTLSNPWMKCSILHYGKVSHHLLFYDTLSTVMNEEMEKWEKANLVNNDNNCLSIILELN